MKLSEIGEFGFIERFARSYDKMINKNDSGIGDDCAIISINNNENHVISTDLLIENIHFLKDKIEAEHLGYKSLAVNLSDIAAMGAKPLYSFLSIGIPKDTDIEFLDRFMSGYQKLSEKYNTPLMGGDTTKSGSGLVINVAVVGIIEKAKTRLRSMAQEDDTICVSGELGDSAGGLQVLLDNLEESEKTHKQLILKHHMPEPKIHEGIWLAGQEQVNAMIDISDGIASDLKHILKASGTGASVDLSNIPLSEQLKIASKNNNWDIYKLATGGGEDYELLFTIKKNSFDNLNKKFTERFGKPLYQVGKIKKGQPNISWLNNDEAIDNKQAGFNHFQ